MPRTFLSQVFSRGLLGMSMLAAPVAALAVVAGSGAVVTPACARDVTGTCGDATAAIFSGSDIEHNLTIKVKNTGSCPLQVRARKRGESQPEEFAVQPGGESSRNGKFAEFVVRCGKGDNPCKGSVSGF